MKSPSRFEEWRKREAQTVVSSYFRGWIHRWYYGKVEFDVYDGFKLSEHTNSFRSDASSNITPTYRSGQNLENPEEVLQVGGHGMLRRSQIAGFLTKDVPSCELDAYRAVEHSDLARWFPAFRHPEKSEHVVSLDIADLTAGLDSPCVMDIKLGTRTFLESEVSTTKKRTDLALKLHKICPELLSEEELTEGITKVSYMIQREKLSSSAVFGFRIEGMYVDAGSFEFDAKRTNTSEQLKTTFRHFAQGSTSLLSEFLVQLEQLRAALEGSPWFATHELVGSSLLLVYDSSSLCDGEGSEIAPGPAESPPIVRMIDFAKTNPVPDGRRLTHRDEWVLGNHEDGYLTGLDALINLVGEVRSEVLNDSTLRSVV